jgi:hypothetical protein
VTLKEKADSFSKFSVKKWRETIEGGPSAMKKAFNATDNNIPPAPTAA